MRHILWYFRTFNNIKWKKIQIFKEFWTNTATEESQLTANQEKRRHEPTYSWTQKLWSKQNYSRRSVWTETSHKLKSENIIYLMLENIRCRRNSIRCATGKRYGSFNNKTTRIYSKIKIFASFSRRFARSTSVWRK